MSGGLPDLRGAIEHTLLRADATADDVARLCAEAREHGLLGACVSPVFVRRARGWAGGGVRLVTVAGFPLGTSSSSSKSYEAAEAVAGGADEVDMVMAIGAARAGAWDLVEADVRAVRTAIPKNVLKVILETGYFDAPAIIAACKACVAAGADFVKTSTGFGPRGATVDDIRLMTEAVAGRARVKASGGIRTAEQARALVEAGASRIGTSNGVVIARG